MAKTQPGRIADALKKADWDGLISRLDEPEGDEPAPIDMQALEEGIFLEKAAILSAADHLMRSVYIRARCACRRFEQKYSETRGTKEESSIKPFVRLRPGRPVELAWMRKTRSWRKASARSLRKYDNRGTAKSGTLYRLVRNDGQVFLVRETYSFISRDGKGKYPVRMFNDSPGWVQMLGPEVESHFVNFRAEMEMLRIIRSKVKTIHTVDMHEFEQKGGKRERIPDLKSVLGNWDCGENEDE